MPIPETRRAICATCLRPQRTCICRWIAPVDNAVEVLILQHPLETGEAKGSARLLQLSLTNSRTAIGESFGESELHALLHAPFDRSLADAGESPHLRQPILLYPGDTEMASNTMSIPQDPFRIRLVVLDGTWRKSRKMLHLNPLLECLPRLPLTDLPPSHYRIRKAHRADQLSTLEATCHALARLENAPDRYVPLLNAFDGFVADRQERIPAAHRRQ